MALMTPKAGVRLRRRLLWLAVGTLLAGAVLAPAGAASAASFSGAIWTTTVDGTIVNENHYDAKGDVYLNGGPQTCGDTNGLPDGLYYFQVTDPNGSTLLSSDPIKARMLEVVDGVVAGVGGSGTHLEGIPGCNGRLPVQLAPFDDTPNNGGVYSVDLAPAAEVEACQGFAPGSTAFNFLSCAASKNDNFKVDGPAPTASPAPTTVVAPTPTPLPTATADATATPGPTGTAGATSTPEPTGGTLPATGTPGPTLPSTDVGLTGPSGPTGDGVRFVVALIALLVAAALLLTPAATVGRGEDDEGA